MKSIKVQQTIKKTKYHVNTEHAVDKYKVGRKCRHVFTH